MAHWISSQPGLKEFRRQGLELCIKAKEDLALLLSARESLHKFIANIGKKGEEQ